MLFRSVIKLIAIGGVGLYALYGVFDGPQQLEVWLLQNQTALAALLYLVPLVVMLLTSFKTPEDISTGNLLSWPTVVSGIGWVKAWATVDGYFWNSIKITVPAVLISTAIGALNGYVLSFWRFKGSQLFFGLLLFGCCRDLLVHALNRRYGAGNGVQGDRKSVV